MIPKLKRVIIVGCGFAGLNASKKLGIIEELEIKVIDKRNHHLFQPLLYQVAMAGLSPAEIAYPIRSLLSKFQNTKVIKGLVKQVNLIDQKITTDYEEISYDYLILACGASHTYFGQNRWEEFAPGLKTIEQATEIRRRVLDAFELAEREKNPSRQRQLLTFVVIGGGPTGVELAGAIGEMSRYTLTKDFRNIDPKLTRIMLIEAGPRILPSFDVSLASSASRDLEKLGVQIWTNSKVTDIDDHSVEVGLERIEANTILWAAGVQAAEINKTLNVILDPQSRVIVEADLSIKNYPNVFVLGDQAHVKQSNGKPLPGLAPVAMQEGRFVAKQIINDLKNKSVSRLFI